MRVQWSELERWRLRNRYSLADLARHLGVSSQRLNGWKRRGQVSVDESMRVRAIMNQSDFNLTPPSDEKFVVTMGKARSGDRDRTGATSDGHQALKQAMATMAGKLTPKQANMIANLIMIQAAQNLDEEESAK